jgi:hypothetical protein
VRISPDDSPIRSATAGNKITFPYHDRTKHHPQRYALGPGGAGVYHYAPLDHALEQRARRSQGTNPDAIGFCVGLTSITWPEAWKYGERAFRYCQHDVGHAFAALHYAAAALGCQLTRLRSAVGERVKWSGASSGTELERNARRRAAEGNRCSCDILWMVTARTMTICDSDSALITDNRRWFSC